MWIHLDHICMEWLYRFTDHRRNYKQNYFENLPHRPFLNLRRGRMLLERGARSATPTLKESPFLTVLKAGKKTEILGLICLMLWFPALGWFNQIILNTLQLFCILLLHVIPQRRTASTTTMTVTILSNHGPPANIGILLRFSETWTAEFEMWWK